MEIIIVCLCGVFLVGLGFLILNYFKFKEEKINNEHQFRILDSSVQIDLGDVISTFDTFIEMCLQEYLQININFKEITFINTELEEKILRDVSNKVMSEISPFMINKLSLVYRIESEEELAGLITNKTYLRVLDYVIQLNGIKDNNSQTPNISMISNN